MTFCRMLTVCVTELLYLFVQAKLVSRNIPLQKDVYQIHQNVLSKYNLLTFMTFMNNKYLEAETA